MAKEQCPISTDQLEFNNLVQSKQTEVIKSFWKVFSNDYGLKENQLDALKKSLNQLNLKLRRQENDKDSRKNIKLTKRQIKEIEQRLVDEPKKRPIIKRIEKMLINHVTHLQESQLFGEHVKPLTIFSVLKETMSIPRSIRFDKLSELDSGTLASIERQVSRELHELKKRSEKESKLSWFQDMVMHPLAVSRQFDPTGNSYELMKNTIELAQNAYSSRAGYENTLNDIQLNVEDIVLNEKQQSGPGGAYMFLHDIGDVAATEDDLEQSKKNLYEFLHDIGDNQLVKLIPSPIVGKNLEGELVWTDEFKKKREQLDGTVRSDLDIWKEKIDKQAKSGLNASGDIQKYVHKVGETEIVYYYLMIERKDDRGRVFNVAYEVPYQKFTTESGNIVDRLEFAPHQMNTEFWTAFRERKPSEHLAGISYVDQLNRPQIATGRMQSGWYRATDYKTVIGKKTNKKQMQSGETFTGQTYIDYEMDEDMNNQERNFGIPDAIWDSHAELDKMFQEVAQDIYDANVEVNNRILNVLKKKFKGKDIDLQTDNIPEMIAEAFGVDVDMLNMNFYITGKDLQTAKIHTFNNDFSTRKNYRPIMYSDPDKMYFLLKSREKAHSALKRLKGEKANLETQELTKDIMTKKRILNKQIEDMESVYKNEDLTVGRVLGTQESAPKVNQVTAIKAAKHRSNSSNPLKKTDIVELNGEPQEVVISNGKRKDAQVFNDYLQQTFVSIQQNKVKLDLLEAITNGMPESIKEYAIDQTKAALGRDDIKGLGFFGLDFSDKGKGIFGIDLTESDLGYYLDVNNKITSANLLKGPMTAVTNNFQRFGYATLSDFETMRKARDWRIRDKNGEASKAAAYAGITDEIQTLADGLVPGSLSAEGQEHWASGFWNKTIMAGLLLSSSRGDFTKKMLRSNNMTSRWWRKIADFMISKDYSKFRIDLKKPLSEQQQELFKAREEALGDIWLLTRGLQDAIKGGKEGKAEERAINKKLGRTFSDSVINSHLKFSLGGGAIVRLATGKGWKELRFSDSEKFMRIEALYIAAQELKKSGSIDPDLKGVSIYQHPKVVAHARLLVNNVMFSMSQANLSKMFRGRVGKTLFKFKPYMWNQMGAEWNIIQSYIDELKNKNLTKRERYNVLKGLMTNPKGKSQEQMRNMLFWRGITTFFSTIGTHWIFGAKIQRQLTRRLFGYSGSNAASRGLEFQLVKVPLNAFLTSLMFMGAIDEDEKVYEETYRNFIPLIFNIFIDTLSGDDAFKGVRVYSKGLYEMIEAMKYMMKDHNKVASSGYY